MASPLPMQPVAYRSLRGAEEQTNALARMRRKRLNKEPNHWGEAVFLDLLWGAGPWIVGTCAVAVGLWLIHEHVADAPATFLKFNAPAAIAAISTFSAFLLVSKIQANLACNRTVISEFGNLTGSLINLALWVKSQMVAGKRFAKPLELPDGSGGTYVTNKIGLTLASVPYIVKYVGRGVEIKPEGLPLGQDPELVQIYKQYAKKSTASNVSMPPFVAAILMLSEQIDIIQRGEKKDTEYAVLFAQLNAVTAAEGAIGATTQYYPPYILDALLFVVFILFLVLTLVSDLIPNNNANAIWIAAVVAFSTIAFYQISDRYWNPMALRSKRFLLGAAVLSALAEPVGAVIGLLAVKASPGLNGYFLAFAAGAMLFVSFHELVPMARRYGRKTWFGAGVALSVIVHQLLAFLISPINFKLPLQLLNLLPIKLTMEFVLD